MWRDGWVIIYLVGYGREVMLGREEREKETEKNREGERKGEEP